MKKDIETGDFHPMTAKKNLAKEIVARYHGTKAGAEAEEEFVRVFSNKNIPTDIEEYKIQGTFLDIILASSLNCNNISLNQFDFARKLRIAVKKGSRMFTI